MNDNQLLEMIVAELKQIASEQREQGKTLAGQAEVLRDHTRRSEANEEAIRIARTEMKPLQEHVAFVNMVLKVCGALAGIAATVLIVLNIIDWVSKVARL